MEIDPGMEISSFDLSGIASKVIEWKSKYRNVYYLNVRGKEYIFRLLTKGEYISIYFLQSHLGAHSEDVILLKCILFPDITVEKMDNLNAGEIDSILGNILKLSGFSNFENIKQDLDTERGKVGILDSQIVVLICKAFPRITPSDIEQFDYPTILYHVALAEELLSTKLEITDHEKPGKIDFDKENESQGFAGNTPPITRGSAIKQRR